MGGLAPSALFRILMTSSFNPLNAIVISVIASAIYEGFSPMLSFAAPLYEHNHAYALKLVADLSEDQFHGQPMGNRVLNHAAFVIGHLAWVCDFGATLLGVPSEIDPNWKATFSREAAPRPGGYPPKKVIVDAFSNAHTRLVNVATPASPEVLNALPPERFRSRFPTVGHVILHMLTNHEAVHLGQLSTWRRAMGMSPIL